MTMLPTYKDITELFKKGLTLEAQEKIMELREGALALQEENLNLKMKVSDLEAELNKKKRLRHSRLIYYADGDVIPFCPRCYEIDSKLIHLFGPVPMTDTDVEFWKCMVCHYNYSAKNGESFQVHKSADRAR